MCIIRSFRDNSNWLARIISSHHSRNKFEEANLRLTTAEQAVFMNLQLDEREARLFRERAEEQRQYALLKEAEDDRLDRAHMMKLIHKLSTESGVAHDQEMNVLNYLVDMSRTTSEAVLKRLDELQAQVSIVHQGQKAEAAKADEFRGHIEEVTEIHVRQALQHQVQQQQVQQQQVPSTPTRQASSSSSSVMAAVPATPITSILLEGQRPVVRSSGVPEWELDYSQIEVSHERLGRGAYADVRRGTLWGLDVAVKEFKLPAGKVEREDFLRSFIKEGNLLSRLRHPHIIAFYGGSTSKARPRSEVAEAEAGGEDEAAAGRDAVVEETGEVAVEAAEAPREPCAVMVTEVAAGGSLETKLRKYGSDGLPADMALQIATDLASACVYLHSGDPQVVHGDITPRNVLLTPAPATPSGMAVKLSGFGAAKVREINRRRSISMGGHAGVAGVGALRWLPPEHLEISRPATVESDVYCFALVTIAMFTGIVPHAAAVRDVTLIPFIVQQQPPYGPEIFENERIPAQLRETLRRCMEPNPAKRTIRMTEVLNDLKACAVSTKGAPEECAMPPTPLAISKKIEWQQQQQQQQQNQQHTPRSQARPPLFPGSSSKNADKTERGPESVLLSAPSKAGAETGPVGEDRQPDQQQHQQTSSSQPQPPQQQPPPPQQQQQQQALPQGVVASPWPGTPQLYRTGSASSWHPAQFGTPVHEPVTQRRSRGLDFGRTPIGTPSGVPMGIPGSPALASPSMMRPPMMNFGSARHFR